MSASQFYESRFQQLTALADQYPISVNSTKMLAPIPVDPGTVMAALETGRKVMGLLRKRKGKNNELMDYLKKEIAFIKQLLYDVLDRLEELKVLVKAEFRALAINNLEEIIRMVDESYITWWDRRAEPETRQEANIYYLQLRQYLNVSQNYGYSHYNTVWMAIVYELMFLDYFDKPAQEIASIMRNHVTFYESAINPKLPGSISAALLQQKADAVEFAKKYPEQTYSRSYTERDSRDYREYFYTEAMIVKGNIFEGFTFQITPPKLERVERLGGGGSGGGGGPKNNLPPDIRTIDKQNFDSVRNYYYAGQSYYSNELLPRINELQGAKDGIGSYIEILKEIIVDQKAT
ncbi:hypothetical protein ACQKLP_10795 [Chitinophaga sp. NPDC101104]|uniref:hypothetical protein n=1 Tax=Chitinophaga sp. NPDC101104 TaxID=3390561 RepID=UPI003CFF1FA7